MNKHDNMMYKLFKKTRADQFMLLKVNENRWAELAAQESANDLQDVCVADAILTAVQEI